MCRPGWKPARKLAIAALLLSVPAEILARNGPNSARGNYTADSASAAESSSESIGAITGRLTDLHSAPLAGVTVILENQATGDRVSTVTGKNGVYRFAGLAPGMYSLRAESPKLGTGELDGIAIAAGHVARVQAAIAFAPAPEQKSSNFAMAPTKLGEGKSPGAIVSAPVSAASGRSSVAVVRSVLPSQAEEAPRSEALRGRGVAPREQIPVETAAVPAQLPLEKMLLAPLTSCSIAVAGVPASPANSTRSAALPPVAPNPAAANAVPASPHAGPSTNLRASLAAPALSPASAASPGELPPSAKAPQSSAAQIAAAPVSTTLTSGQLQSLPVSGRRWQQLFLDTPAAAPASGSVPVSLRGAGESPADTTIDGASTRLAFGAAAESHALAPSQDPSAPTPDAARAGAGWQGGRGLAMSSAAIHEVRIEAGNVEARGASAAGGRVDIETESGGNSLHGQGFVSDRQNTWGAQNPFTSWLQNTGTASAPIFTSVPFTPPDHETTWSLGAGSRILRDRLFWFAALDHSQRNDPGLAMVKIPMGKNAETNACYGIFCTPSHSQVQLLSAQLDETPSQAYSDYMGVPRAGIAGAGLETLTGLLGPAARADSQWVGFARIDWKAAERHRFTLEGTGADWSAPGGGLTRISENYGNHSFGSSQVRQLWLLGRWEAFLTPNLLAVTQGSVGRETIGARPGTPSAFEQNFLSSRWNGYGQLPQIVVDSRYGFTIGNPARFGQGSYPDEHMLHGQEMLDWVHGKLLVKAGLELDHDADTTTLLRNQTGTYTYSTVQNFIADALVFEKFGIAPNGWQTLPGGGQTFAQHNCDVTGRPWTDSTGVLHGLGSLPCYSYFSQVIGPNFWQIATNDWASYATAQWQPDKFAVFSAGLRWGREQLPPPIATLANPALTQQAPNLPPPLLTPKAPEPGNQWGPRVSLALGHLGRWPVVSLGYGMYFGRTENAAIETAFTQTGSLKGDMYYFIRPTDGYSSATNTGSAPMFPNVLAGTPASVVTPGAAGFAASYRNPEVHQAVVAIKQELPGRTYISGAVMLSLGRRLPVSIDRNIVPLGEVKPGTITYSVVDPTGKGPIHASQITVPFYASRPAADCTGSSWLTVSGECGRLNPNYQQVAEIESRANSIYEAAVVRFARYSAHGLSLHAHYTYAHAMDWNPNGSLSMPGSSVLDPNPQSFGLEYGTSGLDIRHSAAAMAIYDAPWKMRGRAARFVNGWLLAGIGQFHSGLPYTMRTTGAIPKELDSNGNPTIIGLGPSINGFGGASRVFGVGNDDVVYNIGRNTFRYPSAWKLDLRLGKKFDLGERRELELLAETFNLFNHQNVTAIETAGYEIQSGTASSPPRLCYLTITPTGGDSCQTPTASNPGPFLPAFGTPLNIDGTNFYRERQIQIGAQMRF